MAEAKALRTFPRTPAMPLDDWPAEWGDDAMALGQPLLH